MRTVGLLVDTVLPAKVDKSLSSLKKDDLIALAIAEGVELDQGATRAEIARAIEARQAEASQ